MMARYDGTAMNARTQITLDPEMQRRAQAKATALGISFAEYVRRLVTRDLSETAREIDISAVFDLVDEGPETNITRDKDKLIGEAVWQEHRRKTASKRSMRARVEVKRR
jgi:hypothetical protein